VKQFLQTNCRNAFEHGGHSVEFLDLADDFQALNMMRKSAITIAQCRYMKHPVLGSLDILREERLGNPACTFPIAAAFGDRDFCYSENGAELVIKQNCHYESGGSQLFLVEDCTHFMVQE